MLKQAIASVLFCFTALGAYAEVVNVDNAELARLAASGVPVIDVRTEGEWKQSGVISGSKLLTYFDEQGNVDQPAWLAQVKKYAKVDQPIILICRSGRRSDAASQFLSQQAGYKTVYNANGGMNAWSKEGRSVVPPASALAGCAAGAKC
ncbi:MAG: rhodanese-like domain-containing protein [Propionivibrio sp.]|jgi:rhodanese-related sulfurtransferase|nr:rhodanese-like domain-containing protein [Propionivibrio sp.]